MVKVIPLSWDTAIEQYRESIKLWETRFERSSEDMLKAVQSHRVHETAEICKWLMNYLILQDLERAKSAKGHVEV